MSLELATLENSEVVIAVHHRHECLFEHCPIHNRSDHHMRSWPQHWRRGRGLIERLCPHGVGHPDPDDPETLFDSVHGCDGCCSP